jgi:predicted alpha/beta-hydrolase family hydrolase
MTSQAQAKAPLKGICGLAFLGFPLHPAGDPSQERAAHLFDVHPDAVLTRNARLWRRSIILSRFARSLASAQR